LKELIPKVKEQCDVFFNLSNEIKLKYKIEEDKNYYKNLTYSTRDNREIFDIHHESKLFYNEEQKELFLSFYKKFLKYGRKALKQLCYSIGKLFYIIKKV
jgi:hypothetical protein